MVSITLPPAGLDDPQTLVQPSPFNWPEQALCYLPEGLPDPAARGFGTALIQTLRPVLQASQGRAFLLFASHRALREAAEALRDGPWPLFVQGEAPRATLLQRFRESGNGVLLGSASFREGVDVVGEALSVVMIDKLPFAARTTRSTRHAWRRSAARAAIRSATNSCRRR